jgi:hypothetical protein
MGRRSVRLANELQRFAKQYGRKAQRGKEPNDRRYSRKTEESVAHLKPDALSALLSGEPDASVPPRRQRKRK